MKILTRFVILLLLAGGFEAAAQKENPAAEKGLVWHTDIMKARELSAAGNKPIFAFFTGSDWCIWCKRLQHDVFSKPAFIEWANKNVILLELDFPRGKQLSPELAQQNNSLQQTFQVQGYPTIWMFFMNKDEQGQKFNLMPLGSCGYPQGAEPGKEEVKFLKDANAFLAKKNNP